MYDFVLFLDTGGLHSYLEELFNNKENNETRNAQQKTSDTANDMPEPIEPASKKKRKTNVKMATKLDQEEFDEKLLYLVMDRPAIYDYRLPPQMRNKGKRNELWEQIYKELGDFSGCKYLI